MMSKLFKKRKVEKPEFEQFCFQANNDQMLFFQSEDDMFRYLADYRKRIPIYKLSMFKVQFFNLKAK